MNNTPKRTKNAVLQALVWLAVEQAFGCRKTLRSLQKTAWPFEQWRDLALLYVPYHMVRKFLRLFKSRFYSVAMAENIFIHTLNLIDY